ncbi:MAG: hypothetical protein QOI54_3229 [Actinomycetota bacterium]|jgi:hypothetical protein|nr:hypothetical protein [Actinomycetota bacterium]
MSTTSSIRRLTLRFVAATAAASLAVLVGASTATAAPIPITTVSHHHAHGCSTDLHELVANFRAHRFTAQAANVAAQLTRQACLYG